MKLIPLMACVLVALTARPGHAEGLPSLGETSQLDMSPAMERKIGESIMHEIRRDPAWLGDPEVNAYLTRLGGRLGAQSEEARQEFELFALRDPTLNAFAMPGGYIGVHTGLILAAESESELASVLAHEISHVTQHHVARSLAPAAQAQLLSTAALALAVLASRGSPDLAMGAAMAGQAAGLHSQLKYSRDFEREADRLGLRLLERSGFDIRGMNGFFERLQRFSRLYESNAPGYLRTHPLTTERLADLENRIQGRPYKQVPDSLEFELIRAKLRSQEGVARDAVTEFESRLKDRKFSGNVVATHFGLAYSHLRNNNPVAAEKELAELRRAKVSSPMIETLAATLRLKLNDAAGAVRLLKAASTRYPQERAIAYRLVDALLETRAHQEALDVTTEDLLNYPSDAYMHGLQAKTYALLGQRLQQHRAQAESYALQGMTTAAVEQLMLAQKAGDGNFYELSQVDARLKELRRRADEEAQQKRQF